MTRVAIVGDWRWPIYEEAMSRALHELGHVTLRIPLLDSRAGQMALHHAPALLTQRWARRQIEDACEAFSVWGPDIVFFWRPDGVTAEHLSRVRRSTTAQLVYYHNDNPDVLPWKNRLRHAIREYDYCFGYRPADAQLYREWKAKACSLLMPYSLPWAHYREDLQDVAPIDVSFVGHYEDDGRSSVISALIESGLRVRVWGTGWKTSGLPRSILPGRADMPTYRAAVSGSAMSLAFLSTRNRDVYTRRHFELAAMGACVLSERTPELEQLFPDGLAACYFSGADDCAMKAQELAADAGLRAALMTGSLARHREIGGGIHARMRNVIDRLVSK